MNDDLENFVERMGLFFESEGLPRTTGRMFAYMLAQDEPCSLDDLADALLISRTSISSNARLLEQHGLIQLVAQPGDRKDYYLATSDPARTIELRLQRIRTFTEILSTGLSALPPDATTGRQRIEGMARVNDDFIQILTDLLDRYRPS